MTRIVVSSPNRGRMIMRQLSAATHLSLQAILPGVLRAFAQKMIRRWAMIICLTQCLFDWTISYVIIYLLLITLYNSNRQLFLATKLSNVC